MPEYDLHETSLPVGARVEVRQTNFRSGEIIVYFGQVVGYDNGYTQYLVYTGRNNTNGLMLSIRAYPSEVIEHIWNDLVFRS